MAIARLPFEFADIKSLPPTAPIISRVVTHHETVYVSGLLSSYPPDPEEDIRTQTRKVLERLDGVLADAGTDKSKLLSAQVWLADMGMFNEHNEVWNEWVDRANPPARVCVQAQLVHPAFLVEIMATAAR
jgi:enamine deaminase RidA (YjgF/YER057c/UK114 family)